MSGLGTNLASSNRFNILKIIFPFIVLGLVGSSITFLTSIFNANVRWLLLGFIFFIMITKKNTLKLVDPVFAFILFMYCGWCFLTTFWSLVPLLSFAKSSIYFISIPLLICVGIEWTKIQTRQNIFNYLWPLTICALIAGIFGNSGEIGSTYYQGLVHGANNFGFMMSAILPLLIWKSYCYRSKVICIFWIILTFITYYYAFLSQSRAAICIAISVIFGLLFSLKLSKKITLFLSILPLTIALAIMNPDLVDTFITTFVYKGGQASVLKSRDIPWQYSYEGAVEGGWIGLGFGASVGQNTFNFDEGLTSGHYGREKGNSQLAIVEETGLVGLFIYVALISYLLFKLARLYLKTSHPDQKILIGMIFGLYCGLIFDSCFEAWWHAPGITESIYFWILVGIIQGLEVVNNYKWNNHAEFSIEAQNREILAKPI